jgi:ribonuclease P protein component
MATNFTLGKKERLKSSLTIHDLLKSGKTVSGFPLKIYWDISHDRQQQFPVRMAVSVPRRRIRRAVDRNLVKRRIREAYRLNKNILYAPLEERGLNLVLVILFLSDEFPSFNTLDSLIRELLRKLASSLP